MFPGGRLGVVSGVCRTARLQPALGDRTMFDFGSVLQQLFTTISDLFLNQIVGLISGLFSGLFV
jgi:hypothetical protein